MADVEIRLDHRGMRELLLSQPVQAAVDEAAQAVAAQAGRDAVVAPRSDRAAASVSVPAHRQAKEGALTRAAAAVGLQIRTR